MLEGGAPGLPAEDGIPSGGPSNHRPRRMASGSVFVFHHEGALAKQGATALRASAALNRARGSVVKKARELGLELPGVREAKAKAREMMEQNGSGST